MLRPSPPRPAHPISSVDNALRLLVILRDREEIRVSEASAELGVARSTAHRLLAMLHSHGLVEQSPNRAYRVGPVLAEIGLSALRHLDVRAHIRPFLEQLVAELGETAHFVVREGRNCRFAESVECTHALRTTARVGIAYPAHITSGGKALLAELDDEHLAELYPDEHLGDPWNKTRSALFAELEEIRRVGYARYRGDMANGIAAVGLVLRTSSGRVAGALSVSAPETRMPEERIEPVVLALRRVSEDARRRLP
jgi:IclR family transcriptional regulator, acetate operon repressor